MTATLKEKIIKTLVESSNISPEDIKEALAVQKEKGISLDKILIEKGLIQEKDLLVILVKELRIPFIKLSKYKIDPHLKDVVPEKIARQYRIIPISQLENTITIALSDPLNVFIVDDLKNITSANVDVVMSTDTEIMQAIDNYYGHKGKSSVQEVSKDLNVDDFEVVTEQEGALGGEIGVDAGEEAPIIRMVNLVITEALKQRASDIHMEPTLEKMRVRFRIDGALRDILNIPKENQSAVTVRIKIMSRLDITKTRVPQDGRFKMRIMNQEVDFRVSLLPTTHGEKIVMRVLNKKSLSVGLEGLGFSKKALGQILEAIQKPFGMILVTGPTGSGKSTTLYSIISELNTVDRNIITIEDPVEYLIEGLTQIQARSEIGLTFASGLRSVLRQSPDIVLVGEIRDNETADIAIKASLTGQLVFSTLHTNDAAGALTRLVDMDVESFLVASSLVIVIAQRLCRQICSHCKVKIEIPDKVFKDLKIKVPDKIQFYEGKGCEFCRKTGYLGRLGITEILEIDDNIRDMLIRERSSDEIKDYAIKKLHMLTLRDDVLQKWMEGLTTLEEVLRLTTKEV